MAKKHGCPGKLAANEIVKWLVSIVVSVAILAGCVAVYNCANAPVPARPPAPRRNMWASRTAALRF